jgi:hypothetical protein
VLLPGPIKQAKRQTQRRKRQPLNSVRFKANYICTLNKLYIKNSRCI